MDNKVILYGASGHAKVIIAILQECNIAIDLILDDDVKKERISGFKISYSKLIDLALLKNVIISIGNNKIRKKLRGELKTNFAIAIHPKAVLAKTATVDEGTVIMAGAMINTDVSIGTHCIINTGAIIEHDCVIDHFVHISPGAALAGGVCVGEGSHVGINATIIQNVKIGKWVTVGAGAVVLTDIPDYAVVVGNPGKIIKFSSNE
jgi:acetyltransferase EpsM